MWTPYKNINNIGKYNRKICTSKISSTSWFTVFHLWRLWNCSLCSFYPLCKPILTIIIIITSLIQHGVDYSFSEGQMQNLVLMGVLYAIGVVLFTTRFPESVWPGKFNLIFQSHQLFHVLVVR